MNDKEKKVLKALKVKEAAEKAEKAAAVTKASEVKKMMSPEEQTILGNIQSLIGELLVPVAGGDDAAMMQAAKQEKEETDDYPMDEIEKAEDDEDVAAVDKGLENTASDSATASDPNEARIEETQTELTEESVNEVAKTLMKVFEHFGKSDKPVAKTELGQLVDAINGMVQVQKGQSEKVLGIETALSHIIEGSGIAEQMGITKSVEEKKPVVTHNNEVVAKAIADVLGSAIGNKTQAPVDNSMNSNSSIIRKTLRSPGFLHAAIANKT
jgi:hypothetical protein